MGSVCLARGGPQRHRVRRGLTGSSRGPLGSSDAGRERAEDRVEMSNGLRLGRSFRVASRSSVPSSGVAGIDQRPVNAEQARDPVIAHSAACFGAVASGVGLCQRLSGAMSLSACFGPQLPGL